MKLAIHQPNFLPRLKVLQKLSSADWWVVLDSVQFAAREWQNRAVIVPSKRKMPLFWLTLGVHLINGFNTPIKHVTINEHDKVARRCRESIRHAFRASPYWDEIRGYWDEVEPAFRSQKLSVIALATMMVALRRYGREPNSELSSDISVKGRKSKLMANICKKLGASCYLADSGALGYLDVRDFGSIPVTWQNWVPPPEPLRESQSWENVSFVSYLAAEGPDRLRDHLLAGDFQPNPVNP